MAIEFNCPHCAGSLRVRDNETGQTIPCPHCARRLIVPALPAPAIEFHCPHCSATIRVRGSAIGSRGTCPACHGSVLVPAPDEAPGTGDPFVTEEESASSMDSVVLIPRRKPRSIVYLVPLLVVFAIAAAAIFLVLKPEPPLTGALYAENLETQELGPFVIDRTYCTLANDEFETIREFLTTSPLRVRSQLLRVEFQGMKKGIGVSIHTGDDTEFVRVDPGEHDRLRRYLVEYGEEYDRRRRETLKSSVPAFLEALDRRRSDGKEIDRMLDYRNRVGLASAVGGTGFVVAAHHRGTLYPCIHEDREGRLYFALPRQARDFELVGQQSSSNRRSSEFPGRFQVRIERKTAAPSRPKPSDKREESKETDERGSEADSP